MSSRSQCKCPIEGCKSTMRKDNLAGHLDKKHNIKNYVPANQRTLMDMARRRDERDSLLEVRNVEPSLLPGLIREFESETAGVLSHAHAGLTSVTTPPSPTFANDDSTEDNYQAEHEPASDDLMHTESTPTPSTSATAIRTDHGVTTGLKRAHSSESHHTTKFRVTESEVTVKLDMILEKLNAMAPPLNTRASVPTEPTLNDAADVAQIDLDSTRSVQDILELSRYLVADEENNRIMCTLCGTAEGGKNVGHISYDFNLGCTFDKGIKLPRKFTNAKHLVIRHLKSKVHKRAVLQSEIEEEVASKQAARNYTAGIAIGREAYSILKNGQSYLSFEGNIARLFEHGVEVGDLNHSRKFVSSYSISVKTILQEQLNSYLNMKLPATGRPPPIAVIGDKITPNRRTLQVVGIHSYVAGRMQSLITGVPALSGEDGIHVTSSLEQGLSSLDLDYVSMRPRLVGGAFDGEYLNLGVGAIYLNNLGVADQLRQWYSFRWDNAHILELSEEKARKLSKGATTVIKSISRVSKQFSYGKSFRELLQEAGDGERVRTPGHFSNTRFATYSSIVIRKWMNNYALYYKQLDKKESDDLDKINNATFVLTCAGLCDIYDEFAIMSKEFQKPEKTPWEMQQDYDTGMYELEKKMEELHSEADEDTISTISKRNFPVLYETYTTLSATGEFQKCPILQKQHHTTTTRGVSCDPASQCEDSEDENAYSSALDVARRSLYSFVKAFMDDFKARMKEEDDRLPVIGLVNTIFDVNKIVLRANSGLQDALPQLQEYHTLATAVGALEAEVTYEQLEAEYLLMTNRIHQISPSQRKVWNEGERRRGTEDRYKQLAIYYQLLSDSDKYNGIPNILHLSLTAISRTSCEAVVEGMASVTKVHNELRKSLDFSKTEAESIIRWQGPSPAMGSKAFIERCLDHHFEGRENWHFTNAGRGIKFHRVSEVVDRVNREPCKIPF